MMADALGFPKGGVEPAGGCTEVGGGGAPFPTQSSDKQPADPRHADVLRAPAPPPAR